MLKADIIDFLTREYPNSFTNRAIANRLAAPEPSVRRATLALDIAGKIRLSKDSSVTTNLAWQAHEPVASSASV